jgi:hypothetical protein
MKKTRLTALTVTMLIAVAVSAAPPSAAAPSGTASAQGVVDSLQKNGYRVIVSKIGAAPLDQCYVAAVRPGREITVIDATGGDREQLVSYTTVYVDARC